MENFTRRNQRENEVFIYAFDKNDPLLLQSICAGKNMGGCTIYIGWTLKQDSPQWIGLENPEETKREILSFLQEDPRFSYRDFLYRDLRVKEEKGKVGFILSIKEAPLSHKPVTLGGIAYYFRDGQVEVLDEEVANRMKRFASPYDYDLEALQGYSVEDFDAATLERFRQRSFEVNPKLKGSASLDLLKRIRACTFEGTATRAGLLFFGESEAIRRAFPHFSLLCLEEQNGKERSCDLESMNYEGLYSFYLYASEKVESRFGQEEKLRFRRLFFRAVSQCDFSASFPFSIELNAKGYRFQFASCPIPESKGFLLPSIHPLMTSFFLLSEKFSAEESECKTRYDEASSYVQFLREIPKKATIKPSKETSTKKKAKREDLSFAKEIEGLFREELCLSIASFRFAMKEQVFGRGEFLEATGVSPATGTACLKKLQQAKKIRPVKGQGKGKFRFR